MNVIDPQFKIWQSHLPPLLGVAIEVIRELRKKLLLEGEDWVRDGNRVLLTDAAVKKIRAELELAPAASSAMAPASSPEMTEGTPKPAAVADGPGAKKGPFLLGPGLQNRTELVVYRTCANTRMVEAHEPDADPTVDRRNILRVRVATNENFRRGMVIRVRFVQEPDLFEHVGRMPRWKGKY